MINKNKEQLITTISELREQWKTFKEISNDIKDKLDIVISPELVRYYSKLTIEEQPDKNDSSIKKLNEFLTTRNITVKDLEHMFYTNHINTSNEYEIRQIDEIIKFGVVSDTHLWAKTCAINELHDFYNLCKQEWITDVLHAWDVIDGNGRVYKWQLSELEVFWFDDTVEFIKNNYPKVEWIKTHFITGNHDESYLQSDWADIWKAIARVRDDMNYLWFYDATVVVWWIKIWLHHWAWGWSYAQSYKLQKYVETLTWDNKPQLFILGHYHWSLYMSVRNIHCLLPWCWQKPNNFSVRLWLPNTIWWYIVEIEKTAQNEIRSIKPKFIQYYF